MSGYDEKLLSSAPSATKAERQQGYDPALLEDGSAQPPTVPSTSPVPPRNAHSSPVGQYAPVKDSQSSSELPSTQHGGAGYSNTKAVPFWRTRKGQIIIAVLVLVVLGVIGGVVGGVVSKKKNPSGAGLTANGTTATSDGGPTGPAFSTLSGINGGEGESSRSASTSTQSGGGPALTGIRSSTSSTGLEFTSAAHPGTTSTGFPTPTSPSGSSPTDLGSPQENALAGVRFH